MADKKECFIIMPITSPESVLANYHGDRDHFTHVLDHLFVPAIEKAGLKPVPPKARGGDLIHGEIIKHLETADIVLCDMSTLNPNVFFELGIRTAVNKTTCLVKDQLTTQVPFDTSVINHHTYHCGLEPWTLADEIGKLTAHLQATFEGSPGVNSLWRYFSLTTAAKPIDGEAGTEAKLDFLTMQVTALRQQLSGAQQPKASEKVADDDFRQRYSEIFKYALSRGVRPTGGSGGGNAFTLSVLKGGIPEHVKAELCQYALQRGIQLSFYEPGAKDDAKQSK